MKTAIALVDYSTPKRIGKDAKTDGTLQMPASQVHAHSTVNVQRVAQVV